MEPVKSFIETTDSIDLEFLEDDFLTEDNFSDSDQFNFDPNFDYSDIIE